MARVPCRECGVSVFMFGGAKPTTCDACKEAAREASRKLVQKRTADRERHKDMALKRVTPCSKCGKTFAREFDASRGKPYRTCKDCRDKYAKMVVANGCAHDRIQQRYGHLVAEMRRQLEAVQSEYDMRPCDLRPARTPPHRGDGIVTHMRKVAR